MGNIGGRSDIIHQIYFIQSSELFFFSKILFVAISQINQSVKWYLDIEHSIMAFIINVHFVNCHRKRVNWEHRISSPFEGPGSAASLR